MLVYTYKFDPHTELLKKSPWEAAFSIDLKTLLRKKSKFWKLGIGCRLLCGKDFSKNKSELYSYIYTTAGVSTGKQYVVGEMMPHIAFIFF